MKKAEINKYNDYFFEYQPAYLLDDSIAFEGSNQSLCTDLEALNQLKRDYSNL